MNGASASSNLQRLKMKTTCRIDQSNLSMVQLFINRYGALVSYDNDRFPLVRSVLQRMLLTNSIDTAVAKSFVRQTKPRSVKLLSCMFGVGLVSAVSRVLGQSSSEKRIMFLEECLRDGNHVLHAVQHSTRIAHPQQYT